VLHAQLQLDKLSMLQLQSLTIPFKVSEFYAVHTLLELTEATGITQGAVFLPSIVSEWIKK